MNESYFHALDEFNFESQSRVALAALRPGGIKLSPVGLQGSLEELVRDAPNGMALLDEHCRHLEVSNEYCALLHVERAAILGKTYQEFFATLPQGLEATLAKGLAGESATFESQWAPVDGCRQTRTSWKLHPWNKSRKRIGGIVLFLSEVAEPKQEEFLQSDMLRTILEQAPGFIAITKPDGKITFINAAGRALLGLQDSGDDGDRIISDLETENAMSQISMPPNDPWAGEMLLKNSRTGNAVPMLLMVFATRDSAGSVSGFAHVGVHLHGKSINEETLRAFNEQFESSLKMENVCHAAGGIAHDFNNMLLVINGYSSLLMDDLKSDPMLGVKAASILQAGERAAELTQRLLMLSRI